MVSLIALPFRRLRFLIPVGDESPPSVELHGKWPNIIIAGFTLLMLQNESTPSSDHPPISALRRSALSLESAAFGLVFVFARNGSTNFGSRRHREEMWGNARPEELSPLGIRFGILLLPEV